MVDARIKKVADGDEVCNFIRVGFKCKIVLASGMEGFTGVENVLVAIGGGLSMKTKNEFEASYAKTLKECITLIDQENHHEKEKISFGP